MTHPTTQLQLAGVENDEPANEAANENEAETRGVTFEDKYRATKLVEAMSPGEVEKMTSGDLAAVFLRELGVRMPLGSVCRIVKAAGRQTKRMAEVSRPASRSKNYMDRVRKLENTVTKFEERLGKLEAIVYQHATPEAY